MEGPRGQLKTPGDPRPPILTPALAADGVVLWRRMVLLVKRGPGAFEGYWALPGGFVQVGEPTDRAAVREVQEETGVACEAGALVGVYSDPKKRHDPRGHVVTVAYLLRPHGRPGRAPPPARGADDAREARWWDADHPPRMAFDHAAILRDALRRHRSSSQRRHL